MSDNEDERGCNEFAEMIEQLEKAIDMVETHKKENYAMPKEYYNMFMSEETSDEEKVLSYKGFALFTSTDDEFYKSFVKGKLRNLFPFFEEHFERPFTDWTLMLLKCCFKDKKPSEKIIDGICSTITMTLDEDQHPTKALNESFLLLHKTFVLYPDLVDVIVKSDSFQSGRFVQGLILELIFTDFKESLYSMCLDLLGVLFGRPDTEGCLYINDLNVLLSDVFPALCRATNNVVEVVMNKMCTVLIPILKIGRINPQYEEVQTFDESLQALLDNNTEDVDIVRELQQLSNPLN
ncbi:hypothetical protein EIN_176700 [Entamoeba invadens IP1]|uniref:Uncharacterized protein n=1 Tax=Entamoeba invadens TaxID=33085 RepID=S0B2X6_ENTIV|nr:hypothetical protein EIN_176700 [Entamoeba invadens IP1]ELP93843.1 hypothetical protein EIN_176700 [Entamoeba invadens IP1]BAN40871.1 hypothetical protein [Entamoeba invadens]|eukprot:XP_004260614.1 hypothetical protein EIN_176700 [Entamoeba invadens IP1]